MKKKQVNFISVDVGSSKIASIASNISKKGKAEILGQNLNYSEGIKSGMILDLLQAENCILQGIYALEQECEDTIGQAIISLPGYGTKSYYIHDEIKILGNKVTKNDMQNLIQKNIANFNINDSQIIHYFPIEFTIEGGDIVEDPVGMYSSKLGCRMHIVTANSNMLMNLANCFNKCQIEVGGVVLGIYASAIQKTKKRLDH
jgi:cell division protein FtsA